MSGRLRGGLAQADLREFRIGIGHPRDRCLRPPRGPAEKRITKDDAGLVGGDVHELQVAGHVADIDGRDA